MTLHPAADPPVAVQGRDFATNRGGLCQKGWTSADVLSVADRITEPLLRRESGELEPATWDEALEFAGRGGNDRDLGDQGLREAGLDLELAQAQRVDAGTRGGQRDRQRKAKTTNVHEQLPSRRPQNAGVLHAE
mgnify:CR=1 FL=1